MATLNIYVTEGRFRFAGPLNPATGATQPVTVIITEGETVTRMNVSGYDTMFKILAMLNTQTRRLLPTAVELWGNINQQQ